MDPVALDRDARRLAGALVDTRGRDQPQAVAGEIGVPITASGVLRIFSPNERFCSTVMCG